MSILIVGLVLFLGTHSLAIVAPDWRDRVALRLGERRWQGLYSVAAIVGLVLVVWGFALARQDTVILYAPPRWLRHIALLLLAFVFPLFLATYLPGRIQALTRHPTLLAVKLWAVAHLLANGTLADVVLFGAFLLWAGADRFALKRRAPRPVPGAPPGRWNDAVAIVAGLAIYAAFLLGVHRWLFGVSPLG